MVPREPVTDTALSVRVFKWVWLPALLLAVAASLTLYLSYTTGRQEPRAAPSGLCELIPADLLARIVPAPVVAPTLPAGGGADLRRSSCSVQVDGARPAGGTNAELYVSAVRYGTSGRLDPSGHARNAFALAKRGELANRSGHTRVLDLQRLGTSAYLLTALPDPMGGGVSGGSAAGTSATATVRVLRGDTQFDVRYLAFPSSPELAASAAVSATRALLEKIR